MTTGRADLDINAAQIADKVSADMQSFSFAQCFGWQSTRSLNDVISGANLSSGGNAFQTGKVQD